MRPWCSSCIYGAWCVVVNQVTGGERKLAEGAEKVALALSR